MYALSEELAEGLSGAEVTTLSTVDLQLITELSLSLAYANKI